MSADYKAMVKCEVKSARNRDPVSKGEKKMNHI